MPLRVVFLGTPEVVIQVLQTLCRTEDVCTVVAVVTQAPARRGRGAAARDTPSPVHSFAEQSGLRVLFPEKVSTPEFLNDLRELKPDVCVTAAYGQFLPQSFLSVPRIGTLNIHPSLLPAFRGAAPVQRALEQGLNETGVTVLFSTLKMDAGPIVAQATEVVRADDDAETLLNRLFGMGSRLLIEVLRAYEQGREGALELQIQDESRVSHAAKISPQEGIIDPRTCTALSIVNRIRAFSNWPGVKFNIAVNGSYQLIRIWSAECCAPSAATSGTTAPEVWLEGDGIFFRCGQDSSVLKVTEVQFPGKSRLSVAQLKHGLGRATLEL